MKVLGKYNNGNVTTFIYPDGTKIRFSKEETLISDFAENIDIKITNKCTGTNCKFCHEGSGPNEKHGDIMNLKFVDSLHPFQEVALGGGNILEHPDLIPFLKKLKTKQVIANITLHQLHFLKSFDLVKKLVEEKLVYGVGVSLIYPTDELINKIKEIPNSVIHVINGILNKDVLEKLCNNNLKLLILGYKELRRGSEFIKSNEELVHKNQKYLKGNLPKILHSHMFNLISFDNLAIEQLDVKNILTKEDYEKFYMGDEGTNTFYIDCINKKFAKSSTEPLTDRYDLLDSVDDMFHQINRKEDCQA